MKIGFPTGSNKGLEAKVYEHFGRAPYFTIVSVEGNRIVDVEVLENIARESHEPGTIPRMLADRGVNIVVTAGIGWRARENFNKMGIKVLTGAKGYVKDVLTYLISHLT